MATQRSDTYAQKFSLAVDGRTYGDRGDAGQALRGRLMRVGAGAQSRSVSGRSSASALVVVVAGGRIEVLSSGEVVEIRPGDTVHTRRGSALSRRRPDHVMRHLAGRRCGCTTEWRNRLLRHMLEGATRQARAQEMARAA